MTIKTTTTTTTTKIPSIFISPPKQEIVDKHDEEDSNAITTITPESGGVAPPPPPPAAEFCSEEGVVDTTLEELKLSLAITPPNDATSDSATTTTTITKSLPLLLLARPNKRPPAPLGIIFDIDGTLIAQSRHLPGIRIRPGAIDFIRWCIFERGHSVALWTKAPAYWAHQVAKKICTAVHEGREEQEGYRHDGGNPHAKDHPHNKQTGRAKTTTTTTSCQEGVRCRKTFAFCWDASHLRRQRPASKKKYYKKYTKTTTQQQGSGCCHWCEVYSEECHQCECRESGDYYEDCPCRYVKDLRKIWYDRSSSSTSSDIKLFTKERTLIVEDTPQNCIYNYGNAIYVPTYRGNLSKPDYTFAKLRRFIEETLEGCEDVRRVRKCDHGDHYHACFEQSWLSASPPPPPPP